MNAINARIYKKTIRKKGKRFAANQRESAPVRGPIERVTYYVSSPIGTDNTIMSIAMSAPKCVTGWFAISSYYIEISHHVPLFERGSQGVEQW